MDNVEEVVQFVFDMSVELEDLEEKRREEEEMKKREEDDKLSGSEKRRRKKKKKKKVAIEKEIYEKYLFHPSPLQLHHIILKKMRRLLCVSDQNIRVYIFYSI